MLYKRRLIRESRQRGNVKHKCFDAFIDIARLVVVDVGHLNARFGVSHSHGNSFSNQSGPFGFRCVVFEGSYSSLRKYSMGLSHFHLGTVSETVSMRLHNLSYEHKYILG